MIFVRLERKEGRGIVKNNQIKALDEIYDIVKRNFGYCVAVNIFVNSEGIECNAIQRPFTIGCTMQMIDGAWLPMRRDVNE